MRAITPTSRSRILVSKAKESDALDSKGGFTWVLAGLKALLEQNIELNAIVDAFPQGLESHQ